MNPKVSVIIPIYNASAFLNECLDSILGQTLRQIEVICVDDGSTDNSLEILHQYQQKDYRVQVLTQKNQGAGAARNLGLAQASGEYLSFLDADDFFEKDMYEVAYQAACDNQADVCVFNCDLFDNTTRQIKPCTWEFRRQYFPEKKPFSPLAPDARDNLFRMFNGWPWDKLYLRTFIQRTGLQYQNLRTTNDMYFVFMALARARRIVTVDKILAHQRVEVKTSLSRNRNKSWDCFYIALLEMQQELKRLNLYPKLEKAFVNWALNFSLWQLNTMQGDAYINVYRLLQKEGFERLDITRHDRSYFYSEKEYMQFLKIFTTPLKTERKFEA